MDGQLSPFLTLGFYRTLGTRGLRDCLADIWTSLKPFTSLICACASYKGVFFRRCPRLGLKQGHILHFSEKAQKWPQSTPPAWDDWRAFIPTWFAFMGLSINEALAADFGSLRPRVTYSTTGCSFTL